MLTQKYFLAQILLIFLKITGNIGKSCSDFSLKYIKTNPKTL